MSKTAFQGGCHCGQVRFEIRVDLKRAVQCNCSMCTRRGALAHRTAPEDFTLLAGADALTLYQFGTQTAKHHFCRHCGIHPFARPRTAPDIYSVNLRCLDKFHEVVGAIEVMLFDGQNWEQAAKNMPVTR